MIIYYTVICGCVRAVRLIARSAMPPATSQLELPQLSQWKQSSRLHQKFLASAFILSLGYYYNYHHQHHGPASNTNSLLVQTNAARPHVSQSSRPHTNGPTRNNFTVNLLTSETTHSWRVRDKSNSHMNTDTKSKYLIALNHY